MRTVTSPWCSDRDKFTFLSHALQCCDGKCMWVAATVVQYLLVAHVVSSSRGFKSCSVDQF